ncbi:uncharacterized protein N7483_011503 [Penicillium malachiteum]|uniref:uncharacterized protein n=1 Tax=Penicillium malachiteum TaxID=1324776 RepID=UPI002547F9C4|nr:uncharacterized protein N7483_011503 [Penicillium malachiteum]KAJ5714322.1 hypothetical protein N7483_011503 [Penicillium malachiteum]
MIFDGADDLESVRLSRYFPSCPWDHIIVTSQDQAAVGLVAPAGQAIEPLEEKAAIGLLLEKAALSEPSLDDIKQATTIVHSLGCLPLAVDQADASEASHLLILFSFLEAGVISESMLLRGCSPKKVWGRNGEMAEVSPAEAGLDSELVTLLNNEMQLDNAIEQLLAFSLIESANSVHERRAFGNVGREMFAHVPRILKKFDQLGPDCSQYSRVKQALCVLLISAARFHYNPWKRECIHRIKGLLNDKHDSYLKAQAVFTDALVRWYRALGIVERSGWTEGFNHGVILFSIAQVLIRTGKLVECHSALENAQKSLAAEERKYWIVGLGSYWYDYVVTSLGKAGPSPVVMRDKEVNDALINQIFGRGETNASLQRMADGL